MPHTLTIALEFSLVLALADFVSGLVHWAEDTFGRDTTPVFGAWIVRPNMLHHSHPSAFLEKSWLASSWDLLLAGCLIVIAAWTFDALSWHVWLFAFVSANANQIHKWNHVPRSRIPAPVRWLQELRVLQNAPEHGQHHRDAANRAYCVVTPWLNPLLDTLRFWRILERIVVPFWGAPRREDLGSPEAAWRAR